MLSGMIRRKLLSVSEQERQRSQLVNVLILAQALFTLAITVGYIGTQPAIGAIAAGCAALAVYVTALLTNRVAQRISAAAYILVVGGSIAIGAQVLLQAVAGNANLAGQAALLFAAIILEAGLLFAPEVTLITAAITTAFTAFAILLALSVAPQVDRHQAYLLVVYTLGLQALAGLIAWLLAQFIFESALEAQRSEELQFAQARLEALSSQLGDQAHLQEDNIRQIQNTITRALGGEYTARLDVLDGHLAPLTDSLNLLLQRVETATQAEQMRSRLEAAALPLIDSIAHMADTGTPTPSSLPIMTNTPLDSVAVVLNQMLATVAQRLGRVQRLATDMVGALSHSQDGLTGTTEAMQEAQRIAGALISTSEAMLEAIRRQAALTSQMQRMLAVVLPPEITQMPSQDDSQRDATGLDAREAAALLGLGPDLGIANPGYTGEFSALRADDSSSEGADIPPLTVPLPIVEPAPGGEGKPSAQGAEDSHSGENAALKRAKPLQGELPAELVEVWTQLGKLNAELTQMERSLAQVRRDLGVQSRNMRTADANIAWLRQALNAVRGNAEQLQQVAGANLPPPGPSDSQASPSRPLPPRAPLKSRPLTDRLDESALGERGPGMDGTPGAGNTTPPDDVPAPGSLRLADLISFDDPPSGPLGPTSHPLSGAPGETPRPNIPEERE